MCSGVSESANEGGGVREGEEEGEDGTEEGLEVKCRGCFAVHLRIGKLLVKYYGRLYIDALRPGFTPSSCSNPRHTNAKSSTRRRHLERELDA
jgi:hypothetical protein